MCIIYAGSIEPRLKCEWEEESSIKKSDKFLYIHIHIEKYIEMYICQDVCMYINIYISRQTKVKYK